ncbi:MAG: hypothetical protein ABIQ51_12420 [Mesorhizobium sp.]
MSLFTRLRAGSGSAVLIPYKYVELNSGVPDGRGSHENAHDFVTENAGYRVVRGWRMSEGGILDKRVIVESIRTGRRFDVTPPVARLAFFEHPGTADEYDGLWHQISLPPFPPPAPQPVQAAGDMARAISILVSDAGVKMQEAEALEGEA